MSVPSRSFRRTPPCMGTTGTTSTPQVKEQGAEVLALACTGLATIGIAGDLERETGLPVIDPVMAEGLFAHFEAVRKQHF